MRLNKHLREEIVSRVMKDVPQVHNYTKVSKLLLNACGPLLPIELQLAWDKAETRGFIKCDCWERFVFEYTDTNGKVRSATKRFDLPVPLGRIPESILKECHVLLAEQAENDAVITSTRRNLRNALDSITSVKKFKEMFPELAKYAPEEDEKLQNLPMVTNVVTSLRDAGWPKPAN